MLELAEVVVLEEDVEVLLDVLSAMMFMVSAFQEDCYIVILKAPS